MSQSDICCSPVINDRFVARFPPLVPDRGHPGPFAAQAWVERLIAPLLRGSAVLDLGCGGGEPIARFLIDRGFAVTGIDLAQSQIDLARVRFPRDRWLKADMRSVVLEDRFDAVVAWNSLTWLSHADQALMATRAAEWLKPGGRLLFNAEPDHDPTRADYRTGTPYRADLEAANYSAAITRRGLVEMAHIAEDPSCGGAGVWLARKP